jgi:hypothetical protein
MLSAASILQQNTKSDGPLQECVDPWMVRVSNTTISGLRIAMNKTRGMGTFYSKPYQLIV